MRGFLLIASFCTILTAISFADPTEAQLMAEAQRAYVGGDYDTATQLFTQVIEQDPQNTLAIQYLRNIRKALAGTQTTQQNPIKGVVIPQINFRNATFAAALDFFKQAAAKQSVTVSFVPNLPPEQLNRPITLNLTQVPFLTALDYLCQLDNSTYKVEQYAIVITPAPAAAADSTQPAPPQ
jgi:hypothetical protein